MILSDSLIELIDNWLDEGVAEKYKDQPMAQDWARVSKIAEEVGEAIAELILATGQNPRKGHHPEHMTNLMQELADVVMTGILAIQHFTKDIELTRNLLQIKLDRIAERVQ